MKITHPETIEWKRGLEHRGGTFHHRHMFDGEPDSPGNFQYNLGRIEGDFASPRHRHNFEQFRYQVEGTMNFDRNGKMTKGTFGYFPEGASYGPQSSEGTSYSAVLQFGGASGAGYLSRAQVRAGQSELEKIGVFEGGIFRRNDDVEGRRNSDAYQAIWEHHNGARMDYPKPRYRDPVMVDPENYAWVAISPGVFERYMGTFTERKAEASFVKLEKGATWKGPGRTVYLVTEGAGTVEGDTFGKLSGVHAQEGEAPVFTASEETIILRMTLPDLAGLEQAGREPMRAAAE